MNFTEIGSGRGLLQCVISVSAKKVLGNWRDNETPIARDWRTQLRAAFLACKCPAFGCTNTRYLQRATEYPPPLS
jgi:hypothetical protein